MFSVLTNRSVSNLITRLEYGMEQWNGLWNSAEVTIFHCIIVSFIFFPLPAWGKHQCQPI